MLSRSLYGLGLAAIAAISWGTIGLAQSYAQPTIDASHGERTASSADHSPRIN